MKALIDRVDLPIRWLDLCLIKVYWNSSRHGELYVRVELWVAFFLFSLPNRGSLSQRFSRPPTIHCIAPADFSQI